MRVLVLGATGYVGTAVAGHLVRDGHAVVGLARDVGGPVVEGVELHTGDLRTPSSLEALLESGVDAVVHAATPLGDEHADAEVVRTILAGLRRSGKPFLYTSGVWVLGATTAEPATEAAEPHPIEIVRYRPRIERMVLDAAAEGIRTAVLRPGIVHGHGGGIPALMVEWARQAGAGRYVGRADTTWPMVHVDDLAALYTLALTGAPAGTLVHGVAEEAVSTVALAAAADVAAGGTGRAVPWLRQQAVSALGPQFAEALALRQSVSGAQARTQFGWQPTGRDAVGDLLADSYRAAGEAASHAR